MTTALHRLWLPQLIITWFLLTSPATTAQSLFNKAFGYEGYMGNLEPVSGPGGFLICSRVRFGTFDDIDGFQFTRFDSTGSVIQTSAFSTGPLSYSLQHGALARSRSNGSFSFLFGGFTALRIFNTTAAGSVNWNRIVRFANPDYLIPLIGAMDQAFEETPDGGYLITALRNMPSGSLTDTIAPMILKLDSTGNVLWNKTYALGQICGWQIVSHVGPSGETLFGFDVDAPCGLVSDNCILTKIDPDGTTLWSKRIDGFQGMLTGCVKVDGRYVVSAMDTSSIYIFEMDTAGMPLWSKRYTMSFPLPSWSARVVPTHDHGFVLTAEMPDNAGGSDVYFVKVDSLGAVQWERAYGNDNYEWLVDLVENEDSTFTMLSGTQLIHNWSEHFYLSRLDSTGMNDCIMPANSLLTATTFPFSLVDVMLDEFESPMLSQPLYVNDSTSANPTLVDTCLYSDVVGLVALSRTQDLLVYPNPTVGTSSVRVPDDLLGANLTIVDVFGKRIKSVILTSTETLLDLQSLPGGVYLYHVVTPRGRTLSGRLIKE